MSKKGEATKRIIKEHAIKLFAERGFKDITICCGLQGEKR